MKNKGFTLVEILAVITILSIVLVIAVPKVSNIIEGTKRKAFKLNNLAIIKKIKEMRIENTASYSYVITSGVISPQLDITGEMPSSGTITMNSVGDIELWTQNSKFCALKLYNSNEITIFDLNDPLCVIP